MFAILRTIGLMGARERAQELNPEIRQQGYDACMAGNHVNRFAKGTPEYAAWEAGQRKAFNEQAMYW